MCSMFNSWGHLILLYKKVSNYIRRKEIMLKKKKKKNDNNINYDWYTLINLGLKKYDTN